MNISAGYFFVLGMILFNLRAIQAQVSPLVGALPSANVNWSMNSNWSLNTKIETRYVDSDPILTDLSLIGARRIGLNSRISAGYLIRFEGAESVHRWIQQYTVVQRLRGFRLAHRWVADQSFSSQENLRIRFRYRIAAEWPLNGKTLDPREFYLKISSEYLNALQDSAYDLEIRWVPILGYSVTDNIKLESGLDYRVDSFLRREAEQVYWFTFNVFVDL